MKAIPHCQRVEDYEALLPWNIKLAKIGETAEKPIVNPKKTRMCAIN